MFDTAGLNEAVRGRATNEERRRAAEQERESRDQEAKLRADKRKAELLSLWEAFIAHDDYARLAAAMETMGERRLFLGQSLEYHFGQEKPFVHVYNTGGYYSQRVATEHSPEAHFGLATEYRWGTETAEEEFGRLLARLNEAFERMRHQFRYDHDPEYRAQVNAEEAAREKRATWRLYAWMAAFAAVLAGIMFLFLR